jgi:D-glycero-D-manno-heptose 1,7-bisphosphate phosphatase
VQGVTGRAAAFLDRDGTINVKAADGEYVTQPEEVRLLPGAADAIRRLNDVGALVVVVSNQRGISLGRMTEVDLAAVHAHLADLLDAATGGCVDAFMHCPHDINECDCRKPGIGMLAAAMRDFPDIDPARSVLIGDSRSDVEAGRRFGVRSLQLGVDAPDLATAVSDVIGTLTT